MELDVNVGKQQVGVLAVAVARYSCQWGNVSAMVSRCIKYRFEMTVVGWFVEFSDRL